MAFPEDLERFAKALPFDNDYQKKLKHKMKLQLQDQPARNAKRENDKVLQYVKLIQQQKIEAKQERERLTLEWMLNH